MRKFSGALGLRGYERVDAGASTRTELRWCIPLPRAWAQYARTRIEQSATSYRDHVIPRRTASIEHYEGAFLDTASGRVGYMAGGSYASLRRMLLVDTAGVSVDDARRRAARALAELEMGALAEDPRAEELQRHVRAMILARHAPPQFAQLWSESELWPPSAEVLQELEDSTGAGPELSSSTRIVPDRATVFALTRDHALGWDLEPPKLYVSENDPAQVAWLCERGFVAARWLLLAYGLRPRGLIGIEDLKSPGAAYVAAKVLLPRRIGTFIEENAEYTLVIDGAAFDRLERFALDRDGLGSLAALAEGLSDERLATALKTELLTSNVEILFPDALPPSLIVAVICKSEEGREALLGALEAGSVRVRTVVSNRYVSV